MIEAVNEKVRRNIKYVGHEIETNSDVTVRDDLLRQSI